MGTTNNGGQILTFDFKQQGTSEGFNKLFYKLLPTGILSGGQLTRVTDTSITISPMLCFYEDTARELGARLETTLDANVTVSSATPFVVGRFVWLNVEENYMDFLSVSYGDIEEGDLIFGKCVYSDNITLSRFDYSRKSWSKDYYENIAESTNPDFLVFASEPYSTQVIVGKGSAFIGGRKVNILSNTPSPIIDTNVSTSRKDLLTITQEGSLKLIKGKESVTPIQPLCPSNHLPIAIITLPSNPTSITGDMIEYIYTNNHVDTNVIDLVYPVGSLYWSSNSTTPEQLWGVGTWVAIKDKFVWAKGDSDTINATGGAKTHKLIDSEMPTHTHTFTGSAVTSGNNNVFHTHGFSGTTGSMSANATGSFASISHSTLVTGCFSVKEHSIQPGKLAPTGSSSLFNYTVNVAHTHNYSGTTGNESATHKHSVTASGANSNTGGGTAHNNMPPYIVKYCWERTA